MGLGFKTFVAGVLSSSDVNGYLMQQAVIACTAATRPGAPVAGMTIYQTDTDSHWVYNGSIWREVSPIKQRLSFTPAGNLDTPGAGTATWVTLGTVTVPAWATQCIARWDVTGPFATTTGNNVTAALKIGAAAGGSVRLLDPGVVSQRFYVGFNDLVTGLAAGAQSVTLSASFVAGTGVCRVDAQCRISATFDFLL